MSLQEPQSAAAVHDEHGCNCAVGFGDIVATDLGEEGFDRQDERLVVADPRQMVVSRQLDVPRGGDAGAEVATVEHRHQAIVTSVENERRDPDRRQDRRDVALGGHTYCCGGCRRACPEPEPGCVPATKLVVVRSARTVYPQL